METISKLYLDTCISILLIGNFSVREQFISLWQQKQHINPSPTELLKNVCIVSEHNEPEFDGKTIYCNLWNAPTTITNSKRHFMSNHMDFCIILCNLRSENAEKIAEYINLMQTLGVTEYIVIGMSQTPEDDSRKHVRDNIISILEYGKKQDIPEFIQLVSDDWSTVHDVINRFLILEYNRRKRTLNDKFNNALKRVK